KDELARLQGTLHERKGELDAAVRAYQQRLDHQPADVQSLIDIARCRRKQGELSKADSLLSRAVELYPSHPEAHYELALIHERSREPVKARAHVNVAVRAWSNADAGDELVEGAQALAARLNPH